MHLKYRITLFLFMFVGCITTFPIHSTDTLEGENQWSLMRSGTEAGSDSDNSEEETITNVVEYAHYYSEKASIKYKGDLVFGEEYDGLTNAIKERRSLLRNTYDKVNKSPSSEYPNYMAVILCATGKKEGDQEPKRVFSSLRVKKDTATGKHTFSRNKTAKIVIFYSDANSVTLEEDDCSTFLKVSSLTKERDQAIIDKTKKTSTGLLRLVDSHTEPLALSSILSLRPDTFLKMLGNGYSLMYYEIHLISYYDACCDCPKTIRELSKEIRERFTDEKNSTSEKLFTFFHSVLHYEKGGKFPYTLKCKLPNNPYNYFNGKIPNFQYIWIKKSEFEKKITGIDADKYDSKVIGSYTLISSYNFTRTPDFYIAICSPLENSKMEPHMMRKIWYYNKKL